MSTLINSSDMLRRAVVYIDEILREHPEKNLDQALDEAAMRFSLSPLDYEALSRILAEEEPGSA